MTEETYEQERDETAISRFAHFYAKRVRVSAPNSRRYVVLSTQRKNKSRKSLC